MPLFFDWTKASQKSHIDILYAPAARFYESVKGICAPAGAQIPFTLS